jgi:hypothetical protein
MTYGIFFQVSFNIVRGEQSRKLFSGNVGEVKQGALTQHSFGGIIDLSESRLILGAMRQGL